jgi:hypothetical protein
MEKYNNLLLSVATKYHILRGASEPEAEWKTRLVYSICGMMAYASLWDEHEEEPSSIVHFKRKVRDILSSYKSMYPELTGFLPYSSEELEDEIEDIFINSGVVYHRPNRVAPSMKHETAYSRILFQRGIALDHISCVSGIGFYIGCESSPDSVDTKEMFGLERANLSSLWNTKLSSTSWQTGLSFDQSTEYLRMKPPFSQGYWVNKPDTTGSVSILRTGIKGSQLYFLYRYTGKKMEVSQLPSWQVEAYNYRTLACACLSSNGTLPPIEYYEDGAIVHLRMNYLLPPRELMFLKLYSWPEICTTLPYNFKRKLSTEVFGAIKNLLLDGGFELKERLL